MTYAAQESSASGGAPIELYAIGLGNAVFRYNTTEASLTVDGDTYAPLEISRSSLSAGTEQGSDVITIELPASTPIVRRYINIVPGQVASLTILRYHRTDATAQTVTIFKGLVRSVAFTLQGLRAIISAQPVTAGLSRTVPRFVFSGTCNHVLYDGGCSVGQNGFRHIGAINSIDGDAYTINDLSVSRPDGWATGGFVQSPNATDFRLVLAHVGDILTLLLPFPADVAAGQEVQVFAGCDHSLETCVSKFSNGINFGGFNWVPRENVFVKGV